jgi:hypothetical protein
MFVNKLRDISGLYLDPPLKEGLNKSTDHPV